MSGERHILGLSGGRDSAALAVYMRQNHPELPIEYFFCQRRSKNRPRGGAKVGHLGARLRPPGGRSPSGGLMRALRFFEGY